MSKIDEIRGEMVKAMKAKDKARKDVLSLLLAELKNVEINYKGYNPLFTMLLGESSADCEIDSIHFDVKSENSRQNNTLYAIVQKEVLELFIKDIYFFIIENKIEQKLNERDKSIWSF